MMGNAPPDADSTAATAAWPVVVLVEDPPGSQAYLADALAGAGWPVLRTTLQAVVDEPAALRHAAVVVIELQLGDSHALDCARAVRAALGEQAPLLLSTSTLGHRQFFEISHAADFDVHIVKPIPVRRLLELLVRP